MNDDTFNSLFYTFVEMRITNEIFLKMKYEHIREFAGDLRTAVVLSSLQSELLKVGLYACVHN